MELLVIFIVLFRYSVAKKQEKAILNQNLISQTPFSVGLFALKRALLSNQAKQMFV